MLVAKVTSLQCNISTTLLPLLLPLPLLIAAAAS
jgi:hypothetical protein